MPRPLLIVLDLDETLFHSADRELDRPADFRIGDYYTYKRPGVDVFLSELLSDRRFEVAIWTSATRDYLLSALNGLSRRPLDFRAIYDRNRCTRTADIGWGDSSGEPYLVKDLQKLIRGTDWTLERTIAIDDNPRFYERQYSNLLRVDAYEGGEEAQPGLFPALLDYLGRLAALDNVRPVEKRGWYRRQTTVVDLDIVP